MNIINVYNALAQCEMSKDLSSDIQVTCIQMHWPEPVQDVFVPRGNSAQLFQLAVALCISTSPRQHLLRPEELRQFDALLMQAQANWAALHKPNKVSRILTDYLRT